jgi:hypothetical protein
MASGALVALITAGVGLGAYALYRSNKGSAGGKIKTTGYLTGAGAYVDYKNPSDSTSDKRKESPFGQHLVKPYAILNPGGGIRPMEIDALGTPTGRELVLPGEPSNPSAILVGLDHHVVDYQNPADAETDSRSERDNFIRPYQVYNPGGDIRPFEVDAHGQPTGRQLVMPGESPTVGDPSSYIMVGHGAPLVSPDDQCWCSQGEGQPLYPCACGDPNVAVQEPAHMVGAHGGFGGGHFGHGGFGRGFGHRGFGWPGEVVEEVVDPLADPSLVIAGAHGGFGGHFGHGGFGHHRGFGWPVVEEVIDPLAVDPLTGLPLAPAAVVGFPMQFGVHNRYLGQQQHHGMHQRHEMAMLRRRMMMQQQAAMQAAADAAAAQAAALADTTADAVDDDV